MNQKLHSFRWFFSLILTLAFCLSQFSGIASVQLNTSDEVSIELPSTSPHAFLTPFTAKSGLCQLLADTVEDDINDECKTDVSEVKSFHPCLHFSGFASAFPLSSSSKLHNHPFRDSKPFTLVSITLANRVFRI